MTATVLWSRAVFTFHEDNDYIKKLLEGEVTISIFIS